MFYAGDNSGPESDTLQPLIHIIEQSVDVSQWADAIDASQQSFAFSARLRTFCGLDAAAVEVDFVSADGAVLGAYKSCMYRHTLWGLAGDVRVAPVGTRSIVVRGKSWAYSGTASDGYFDDFSLLACGNPDAAGDDSSDCPAAPAALKCLATTTSVVTSSIMDEVEQACTGILSVGGAFGFTFPQYIRTGYCTQTCASKWRAFKTQLNAAVAPTGCQMFTALRTTIDAEIRQIDARCASPVSDDYALVFDDLNAGSVAAWQPVTAAVSVVGVAAATWLLGNLR